MEYCHLKKNVHREFVRKRWNA